VVTVPFAAAATPLANAATATAAATTNTTTISPKRGIRPIHEIA
jgi:hypothetical protein